MTDNKKKLASLILEKREKRREVVEAENGLAREAMVVLGKEGEWTPEASWKFLEGMADDVLTWEKILTESGWVAYKSDGWTRPGGSGKSAVAGSTLTLMNSNEGTGMADLRDAGVELTRWRVFLRSRHSDDVSSAVEDLSGRYLAG